VATDETTDLKTTGTGASPGLKASDFDPPPVKQNDPPPVMKTSTPRPQPKENEPAKKDKP
ncbi:MAG: hypothetical protein ACRD6X_19505, partial [Pyrinomonadaceae bacterium]